jgi:hypothetical protein
MTTRRQFLGFLAPLALVPVVDPHMLLSERPKSVGWTHDPHVVVGRPVFSEWWEYQWVDQHSVAYFAEYGWRVCEGHSVTPLWDFKLIARPKLKPSDTAA